MTQHLFEGQKARSKPWSLTVGVHVVSGHLRWGEPLPEGVRAIDALLHAQQLLGRGQSGVGVQHPLQPRAATAVRLGWKIKSKSSAQLGCCFLGGPAPLGSLKRAGK